ncbi:MAG: MFS transporter [Chlamydiae bacterium]|nr:MFS transporter [Chlamydiota bacterium]
MIWILFFLVSFGPFTAFLITPAFPAIAHYFAISESHAHLMITGYLLGYAFGILLYGPIANRIGRKKGIFVGLGLAVLGTLLCLLAPSFNFFVFGRIVQALGTAGGFQITFTLIGDRYKGGDASRILAIVLLSFSATPGIATSIGGYLTENYLWKSNFIFLIGYTTFLVILSLFLPRKEPAIDKQALSLNRILQGYGAQFKNRFLLINAALMGISTGIIYIFAAEAPFLAIELMRITPAIYGYLNIIPSVGMIIGSLLLIKIAKKFSPQLILFFAILASLTGIVAMGLLLKQGFLNEWSLFLPFAFSQIGNVIIFPVASAEVLSKMHDKSYASSTMQFCNIGLATLLTWIVGATFSKVPISLPIVMGVLSIIMVMLWLFLKVSGASQKE